MSHARIPVLVGVGEILDRPDDPALGREPLTLMAEALRAAQADCGANVLAQVQSLVVVNCTSWRYKDLPAQVSSEIGASPRQAIYAPIGGETPLKYLHEAALAIQRGELDIAAVCGAEAQGSVTKAKRAGIDLPWTPWATDVARTKSGVDMQHPLAVKLGVRTPVTIYPFYDQGSAAAYGQSPAEALAESGELWSRYAAVAAKNPNAWLKTAFKPSEITTPSAANRLIAWPYTKLMVANPMVNQGAAFIITSLERARSFGIADEKCVFLWGGAAAIEPRDILARDQYAQSHAQNAVLEKARDIAGAPFDLIEIYSCFPCVPKMARRSLDLPAEFSPTVTGGLTFHGAPMNNYMAHAVCNMVRELRARDGIGLLYGQGEFVTKHHALVVSREPGPSLDADYSVQAECDRRYGAVPQLAGEYEGAAAVETYTVLYDESGAPVRGVVILTAPDHRRTIAEVDVADAGGIARLTSLETSAIGAKGFVRLSGGDLKFAFAG